MLCCIVHCVAQAYAPPLPRVIVAVDGLSNASEPSHVPEMSARVFAVGGCSCSYSSWRAGERWVVVCGEEGGRRSGLGFHGVKKGSGVLGRVGGLRRISIGNECVEREEGVAAVHHLPHENGYTHGWSKFPSTDGTRIWERRCANSSWLAYSDRAGVGMRLRHVADGDEWVDLCP